jgi:hypothetical protein
LAAFPLCWDSPGSIENSRWKTGRANQNDFHIFFENLSGQDRAENALADVELSAAIGVSLEWCAISAGKWRVRTVLQTKQASWS